MARSSKRSPCPTITREQIDAAFAKFHGDFYQMPPMVSAIKKDGVPLYKLARQGKTVEREPRFVHVYAHEIQARAPARRSISASSARKAFTSAPTRFDIGNELGCGAHLKRCAARRAASSPSNTPSPCEDIQDARSAR